MSFFDGLPEHKRRRLIADMEYLHPGLTRDEIISMPEEWLKTLYPDLKNIGSLGPNFPWVNEFYQELRGNVQRRELFFSIINNFPDIRREWPFPKFSYIKFIQAYERMRKVISFDHYGMVTDTNTATLVLVSEHLNPLPLVKAGVLALQHRHLLLPNDSYSIAQAQDYNILTLFLRTYWGQIHPDDTVEIQRTL